MEDSPIVDEGPPQSVGLGQQVSRIIFNNYSTWLYVSAAILYLVGFWEHIPYAGGHIYSDIVTVFGQRFYQYDCGTFPCKFGIPYVNNFVEYPVLVGFFMWTMGNLANSLPLSLPANVMSDYYSYTAVFLFIPTLLLIRETLKIGEIIGLAQKHRRVLLFVVATPTFIFMFLLNWYIIGTFFAFFALRKFLEGSRFWSGILIGISAMSNLVTAVPAFGMLFGLRSLKELGEFLLGIIAVIGAVYLPLLFLNSFPHSYINSPPFQNTTIENIPFIFLNPNIITNFLAYQQNWYIEGSWMLAFLGNLSPYRHYIFPALFVALSAGITFRGLRILPTVQTEADRARLIVYMSWLFMFAFLFSTYVSTPQMNVIIVPFFALMPIAKYYPEFLAFDIVNSLVIVWGFSAPLMVLGINYVVPSSYLFQVAGTPIWSAPNQLFAVIRSFWIGKFVIFDGLLFPRGLPNMHLSGPPISSTRRIDLMVKPDIDTKLVES